MRLLTTILYNYFPVTRLELIDQLKNEDVGRSAFYSAHNTLKHLGLIRDVEEVKEGRRVILTELTENGRLIAEKLAEIRYKLDPE